MSQIKQKIENLVSSKSDHKQQDGEYEPTNLDKDPEIQEESEQTKDAKDVTGREGKGMFFADKLVSGSSNRRTPESAKIEGPIRGSF